MVSFRFWTTAAIAMVCLVGTVACTTPVEVIDPEAPEAETPEAETPEAEAPTTDEPAAAIGVFFGEVDSPAGGTVQQLRLPGPEAAAMVSCDQDGFVPFSYSDTGMDWIGCQVPTPGSATGPASSLTEPELSDVPSPVGGTVSMITIPGPQSAISVVCDTGTPFLYEDQGTWVGCQG